MKPHEHTLEDYDVRLVGSERDVEMLLYELGALRELARAQGAVHEAQRRLAGAETLVAAHKFDREYLKRTESNPRKTR